MKPPSKGHFGISHFVLWSFSRRLKCTNAMGKGPKRECPLLGGRSFLLEDPLLKVPLFYDTAPFFLHIFIESADDMTGVHVCGFVSC